MKTKKKFCATDAAHDDRLFFHRNQHRQFRLRPVRLDELPEFFGHTHVVVIRIESDTRLRMPVVLAGISPPTLRKLSGSDPAIARVAYAVKCGKNVSIREVLDGQSPPKI